jgi:hypothetical protein
VRRKLLPESTASALLFFLLVLLSPTRAIGQVTPAGGYTPPDDTQAIRIGAVIFYDYTYQKEPKVTDAAGNRVSLTSFNVPRTYINVTGNISHIVSFRITPDVSRETGTGSALNGSYTFRMKYGYAQFGLDDWLWRGSFARLGIQQTVFIDSLEGIYRYRFQGTVFAERDGGLPSSDAGVSFRTAFPKNYGDVHVGIYNGEGYSRIEVNNQKSFQIRGTLRPLPTANGILRTLRLTGYYNDDHYFRGGPRTRAIFNVLAEHRRFNTGFDYLTGTDQPTPTSAKVDSNGYSFWVTPFFKEKGNGPEALLRYDSFRPNSDVEGRRNRLIVGAAYWFPHPGGNATAALLLDWEQVHFASFATPQQKQEKLMLQGLISF